METFDNFRVLGNISDSANSEITNSTKCLDGECDDLKVRTHGGRGYLEDV